MLVTIIQAHHTDLLGRDVNPHHYSVGSLRSVPQPIWMAVADVCENYKLVDIADRWGVGIYLGAEHDVLKRLICCAIAAGLRADDDVIVRVLLNRPWLDMALVWRQISMAPAAEFVTLPRDFDINFGVDVVTLGALRRADAAITDAAERFRPWLWLERNARTVCCEDVPTYSEEVVAKIRASQLHGDRDNGTCPRWLYDRLARTVNWREDRVLDCACGVGVGTAILSAAGVNVRGCDIDRAAVRQARKAHPRVTYDVQNAQALDYPDGEFGTVVCLDTIEHVDDVAASLASIRRVLRPCGRLIVEVPLLRRRPIGVPVVSSHLREYESGDAVADLLRANGFRPEWGRGPVGMLGHGVARGLLVPADEAREAVVIFAQRTPEAP
jgi:SAM-dependent methyltransferase